MKWRGKDAILWGSVIVCEGLSAFIALRVNDWKIITWGPSLACNLFTTGLAIWVINVVVADFEERERKREEDHETNLETARRNRAEMRRDRRKIKRREMMRLQANWPVMSTLQLGSEVMKAADTGDLQGILAHIKGRQAKYFDHADALGQMITVYNRFLTLKELNRLEGLRRAVKGLAMEVDQADGEDGHKAAIISFLEYLNGFSLALGQALVDRQMMDEHDVFNNQIGALKRKWDIPAVRQRLRQLAEAEDKR